MTYEEFFPQAAREALLLLTGAGYEAYFVGGCVRDFYMSRKASDFDLTTNASSENIIEVLTESGFCASLVGGVCGTVGAKKDGLTLEITPFRTETGHFDHRHPTKVDFVDDIKSDLSRRDFTVNALALGVCGEQLILVDLFGGMDDIKKSVIRCVGNPEERFEEDALRILRALRFASRFEFEIEHDTALAMIEKRHLLQYISAERKLRELTEILENPEISGIMSGFLPVFSEIVGSFVENGVDFVPQSFCERFFYILRFRDEKEICDLLKHLKTDKKSSEKILSFKRIFDALESGKSTVFEIIAQYGYLADDYFRIFGQYENYKNIFENTAVPKTVKELDINGNELLELGLCGEQIRNALEKMLYLCISGQLKNKKEQLILYIKNNY